MQLPRNDFKHRLAAGQVQIGLWSALGSPVAGEIISQSGFDWIVLDMEHAANDVPIVMTQLQAMAAGGTSLIVRPPWNDMVIIKRVLDIGARTIILPYVQNAEEARKAVEFARYPTEGLRGVAGSSRASGYGRIKDYLHKASEEICILLQVETVEALEHLEEIAAVDGVDGIFIGPSDLSASMGHLGNPGHEEVQSVIRQAAQTMEKIGIPSGILSFSEDMAHTYLKWGYKFIAVGSDVSMLVNGSDALIRRFKD